jgi:flagellin-like hook-associated protein FlgL
MVATNKVQLTAVTAAVVALQAEGAVDLVNDLSDYVDEAVGFIDTLKSYLFTGENGWLQLASDTGVEMTNLRMLASDITNVANLHFKEDLGGTIQNVTSINDVLLQDVSGVDIPQSLEIACDTTVGGDLSVSGGDLLIENDSQNPTLTLWSKLTGNQSPTIDLLRNSSTFGADGQYDWRITNQGGNFRLQTQGTSVGFEGLRDMIYINPIGYQFTISDGLTPIILDGTTTTINGNVISSTEPTDDTHLTNKLYVDTADNLKRDTTNLTFATADVTGRTTTDTISLATSVTCGGRVVTASQLSYVWNATGNIQGQLDNITGDITTAEGEIDTLQSSLTTAEGEIDTLQTELDTAETNIGTLQTELDTAETNIGTLQTEMDTAESAIVTLQTGKLDLTGGTVSGDLTIGNILTYDKARCGTTGEIFEDNIINSTALTAGGWVRIMNSGNNIGGTLVVALTQSGRHCYYEIKFSSLFWSESTLRVVNQSAFGTGNIGVGKIRLQSSAKSNGYIGTAVDIYIAQSINASEVTVNLKNAYTDDDYFLVDFTPNPTALNGGVDIKTLDLDLNDITFGGVRANQSGDVISDFKFSREGLLTTSSADVTGDLDVGGDLNVTGNISLPVGVDSQIRVDYVAADEAVSTDRCYANDYRVASNTFNSIQIGLRQNILSGSDAYQAGWLSFNGVIDENSASPLYRYICPYATRLRYLSIMFDDTSVIPTPTVATGGVNYRIKFTFYIYEDTTPSFASNFIYNTYRSTSTIPSGNGSTLLGNVTIFTGFGENLRYTSYRTSDSAMLLVDLTCQQDKCLSVYYKMEMFGDNDSLTPQAFSNIGSEFKITLHGQQVPD